MKTVNELKQMITRMPIRDRTFTPDKRLAVWRAVREGISEIEKHAFDLPLSELLQARLLLPETESKILELKARLVSKDAPGCERP